MNYIDIHTHVMRNDMDNFILSVPIQTKPEDIPQKGMLSVGWHPWFLNPIYQDEAMNKIMLWSKNPNIVAIGETGLDRLCKAPLEYQKEVFLQHIVISESEKKILIIHCVRCFSELLAIKKSENPKMPWILHGFNNQFEIAEQLLKENIRLSFGKALLNPQSNASKVIAQIKESDFFLETDDADIRIEEIYEKAAFYRNISIQQLIQIQENNFNTVFNLQRSV